MVGHGVIKRKALDYGVTVANDLFNPRYLSDCRLFMVCYVTLKSGSQISPGQGLDKAGGWLEPIGMQFHPISLALRSKAYRPSLHKQSVNRCGLEAPNRTENLREY